MSTSSEDLLTKRERMMQELVKGKEIATQLNILLQNPINDSGSGSFSVEELASKIYTSFNETLSVLSYCGDSLNRASQIAASDPIGSACSGKNKNKLPVVKNRRGCYKRRETTDSWTTVSPIMEDGCAWRKYGQKVILNSEHPRCYFRCTHKSQGCKAVKQVQRMKEDPIMYQITYFGNHTCRDKLRAPQIIIDIDPTHESNPLCFETKIPMKEDSSLSPAIPSVEEESKNDTRSDLSDTKSSPDSSLWQYLVRCYDEEVASGNTSCSSTYCLGSLDMEAVNQFGDLDFSFD